MAGRDDHEERLASLRFDETWAKSAHTFTKLSKRDISRRGFSDCDIRGGANIGFAGGEHRHLSQRQRFTKLTLSKTESTSILATHWLSLITILGQGWWGTGTPGAKRKVRCDI